MAKVEFIPLSGTTIEEYTAIVDAARKPWTDQVMTPLSGTTIEEYTAIVNAARESWVSDGE